MKNKKKKYYYIGGGILVLVLILLAINKKGNKEYPRVATETVQKRNIIESISATEIGRAHV